MPLTRLVRPGPEHLPAYLAALGRGWSPDNTSPAATARREQAAIAADPAAFLRSLDDREGRGGPITLPDGTEVPRLPSFCRWIWDETAEGFCGSIRLRWQPGTGALPPHVLGHAGYAVVPWRRGLGHATRALALMLPEARAVGLPWVELTTTPDNIASIRVIERNGGRLTEAFRKLDAYGGGEGLRFRIAIAD